MSYEFPFLIKYQEENKKQRFYGRDSMAFMVYYVRTMSTLVHTQRCMGNAKVQQ